MKVLLAGGGSAGHTSPLLATADALQRLAPGVRDHLPGHPRPDRGADHPRGGLPARVRAQRPAAAPAQRRPRPAARAAARRAPGRTRRGRPDPARRDLRVRRVRVGARLPRRPQAARPPGRPRGQHPPRRREQARCPVHRPRRDQLPRHPAAPRDLRRAADPADDRHPRPGRPPRRGARDVRAAYRPAGAARDRRLPGRRARSTGPCWPRPRRSPRPACRSST